MDATATRESMRGKRYIAYARCATKQGSTQSLDRQIRLIRQFGGRLKMRCVDEVRRPGLGGLGPLLRWDLTMLLTRKFNDDDYEVLVMEDAARLTRAEPTSAARLESLFAQFGVQIVYVASWHEGGEAMPQRTERPRHKPPRGSSCGGSMRDQAQTGRSR